ncbi:MAG: AAA family ATPase [Gammaproteobacteria bacterium]|nr:AAA family ATPase [Gammaproteobacteria bacterium]MBU1978924.1 AAA family ATPase [Gammaproteobacteria bacterium]
MYQSYFNLAEAPFSIAPDPRYLYMSQRHQEALAHLLYGVNGGGGFVLLTGEVGAGKTTVCRCLLEQIPESCDVAYIFNPKLTVAELLSTICAEFGIAFPTGNTSIKVFVDCINAYLLDAHARGRHTVLIIDEAQNLSADVLEQMRLLTNLETSQRKLLQIILLGQPELATMLAQPELRQLAQRIIARYHLGPLTKQEVAAYVRHRLEVSGTQRQLFPAALMGRLYRLSGGIPRIINVLCDRALLGAYVQGKERVDAATLTQAAREVLHQPTTQRRIMMRPILAGLALLAGTVLAVTLYEPIAKDEAQTKAADQAKSESQIQAAKPETALPVTLEWPAAEPLSRSKALAYAALFQAWGADYQGEDACQQAENMGLRCRTTRGGLDELRQLNRPAVLHMRDNQGQEFYATLTQLDDKSATFTVGTATSSVAIGGLAAQWSGHYTLLWRMPPVTRKNIRSGERGPDVEWLSKQLAQVHGKTTETTADPVFDEAMVNQVKQFQLVEGLTPDGAVGPQTLMSLSSAADRTAPRLSRRQGGK